MKHFILFFLIVLCTGPYMLATKRTEVKMDKDKGVTTIIEIHDSVINQVKVTDTISITTIPRNTQSSYVQSRPSSHYEQGDKSIQKAEVMIFGIFALIFIPVAIVLIVCYFRHKNRQAVYRLAEQAIANGQPIPTELFEKITGQKSGNSHRVDDTQLAKGVRNICLGIGLFIFFWALTDEFGVACVGLLIMFMGFGQVIIYYLTQPRESEQIPPIKEESHAVESRLSEADKPESTQDSTSEPQKEF